MNFQGSPDLADSTATTGVLVAPCLGSSEDELGRHVTEPRSGDAPGMRGEI